jgi:hypothetical protein
MVLRPLLIQINVAILSLAQHSIHGDTDEKWIKETRLEIRTGSRTQVARAKKNASCENRTGFEAD